MGKKYQYKIKSKKKAYRMWFLFGSHYAYLGKWLSQILLWLTLLAWLPLVFFPNVEFFQQYLGVFAFGLPSVGVFILISDLLFIPYYVKKTNEKMFEARRREEEKEEVSTEESSNIGYQITY
jgi:hypothetical protein